MRDGFGRLADEYTNPRHYIQNPWWDYGLWAVDKIDGRAQLLSVDKTLDSSYDPYSFLRNVYLQHRDFMVSGGVTTDQQNEEEQRLYDEAQKDTDEDAAPKSANAEERARTAEPATALKARAASATRPR